MSKLPEQLPARFCLFPVLYASRYGELNHVGRLIMLYLDFEDLLNVRNLSLP